MSNKVLLILVDGMRPDSLPLSGHAFIEKVKAHSYYTMNAQTVMPSVTLPCHMSLFHSVTPDRHGILTNTYVPQVRPVRGLFDVLKDAKKRNGLYYNWEELRDLGRPGTVTASRFSDGHFLGYKIANRMVTDTAIADIKTYDLDFTFLYLGYPDAAGHGTGWMSETYIQSVTESWNCIESIMLLLNDDYTVFITADHGGHNRGHGTNQPEDMTIPLFIYNPKFESIELQDVSIIDLAPTITGLLGVERDEEWEGKNLLA